MAQDRVRNQATYIPGYVTTYHRAPLSVLLNNHIHALKNGATAHIRHQGHNRTSADRQFLHMNPDHGPEEGIRHIHLLRKWGSGDKPTS